MVCCALFVQVWFVFVVFCLLSVAIDASVRDRPVSVSAQSGARDFKFPRKSAIDFLHKNRTWTEDRFIVLPKYNLLFCYIEKVGCTSFNRLFNILTGNPHNRWFANRPKEHGYTRDDLDAMLRNKSWHKAVFYRHPSDRFVSAYQSKCNPILTRHCKDSFGAADVSFEDAIGLLSNATVIDNAHWTPQNIFCGGLTNTLQYYDTVELLERSTANRKVRTMMRAANVPMTNEVYAAIDRVFPVNSHTSSNTNKYDAITNSESVSSTLLDTTEKLSVIIDHYMGDYRLFNIKLRPWERRLVQHRGEYKSLL